MEVLGKREALKRREIKGSVPPTGKRERNCAERQITALQSPVPEAPGQGQMGRQLGGGRGQAGRQGQRKR